MPNVKTSHTYFCRITIPHASLDEPLKLLSAWVDVSKILLAAHKGAKDENEHIHFCITLTKTIQKQSFDVRIKKTFNLLVGGNEEFSTKVWDESPDALSYLFHEKDAKILVNKGYTDKDLDFYREANERVQKIIEVNKSAGPAKSVQRIMDVVGQDATYKDILSAILDEVRAGTMYHPAFKLQAMVEEIFIKTRTDSTYYHWKERHIANLQNKYMWNE